MVGFTYKLGPVYSVERRLDVYVEDNKRTYEIAIFILSFSFFPLPFTLMIISQGFLDIVMHSRSSSSLPYVIGLVLVRNLFRSATSVQSRYGSITSSFHLIQSLSMSDTIIRVKAVYSWSLTPCTFYFSVFIHFR